MWSAIVDHVINVLEEAYVNLTAMNAESTRRTQASTDPSPPQVAVYTAGNPALTTEYCEHTIQISAATRIPTNLHRV